MKAYSYIRAEQRRFRRAAEGRAWSIKELPQYYYHRNFSEMLSHVGTRHTSLMGRDHTAFIRDFDALPFAAQCAYARIAGRKGRIFNVHHLHYSEIENIPSQFEILRNSGFVRDVKADDLSAYMASLTKPDLTNLIVDRVCETQFKRSWKKDRLIDVALNHLEIEDLPIDDGVIVQSRLEPLHYLLFLYFGRIETSLQPKTLGELGLVRPVLSDGAKIKFESYEQAHSAYFYAQALVAVRNNETSDIHDLREAIDEWPSPVDEATDIKRGKLLQTLGGLSERQGDIAGALNLYARSDNAACNERVVRLRYKRNEGDDRDWVQEHLEAMIENPSSDVELAFAEDFYARKYDKKRTSIVTDMLRESEILYLDEAYRNSPEQAAVRHYKAKGIDAFRTENRPWRMLFGLLFWEEIYGSQRPRAWRTPECLTTGCFYEVHQAAIEAKLLGFSNVPQTMLNLLKTMTRHYGQETGLFHWGERSLDKIKTLITHAPVDGLRDILRLMAKNYKQTKDGFPDLMLLQNGGVRFVEIKAEGDVLRRNQLTRLRQLKTAGFEADVVRVKWHIDPDQIYVVVDVETTGGRAGLHRVTEIGAVKLQGGEVTDEWSSLINPQRSIPPNITRITGIDEAMVAKAPVFADVADSFADFMGDAIFAAHNVNFDYGFISTEYQMIDRKFRYPKICTCSSMRKLYPGYKSYGLKNLCQELQIDLKTHHRALCDAKAAAELLKLINDKRIDMQNVAQNTRGL